MCVFLDRAHSKDQQSCFSGWKCVQAGWGLALACRGERSYLLAAFSPACVSFSRSIIEASGTGTRQVRLEREFPEEFKCLLIT